MRHRARLDVRHPHIRLGRVQEATFSQATFSSLDMMRAKMPKPSAAQRSQLNRPDDYAGMPRLV